MFVFCLLVHISSLNLPSVPPYPFFLSYFSPQYFAILYIIYLSVDFLIGFLSQASM